MVDGSIKKSGDISKIDLYMADWRTQNLGDGHQESGKPKDERIVVDIT